MENFIDRHYSSVTFLFFSLFVLMIVAFYWVTGNGFVPALAGATGALASYGIQIALPALASAKVTIVPGLRFNEQGRLCMQIRNCMDAPVIDGEIIFEVVDRAQLEGAEVLRTVIPVPFLLTPRDKKRYERSIWIPIPANALPYLEDETVLVRVHAVFTNQMTGFRNTITRELGIIDKEGITKPAASL